MRLLPHLLQVCVFILISTIASGLLIYASNAEEFRSLSKRFMPEYDQLIGLVDRSKQVEEQINTEQDHSLYKPTQDSEENEGFISKQSQFNSGSKLNAPDDVQQNSQTYDQEETIGASPSYTYELPAQATQDYVDEEKNDKAEKNYRHYDETKHVNSEYNSFGENQGKDESGPGQDETRVDEHFRSVSKKVKTVQVNLDDLVEKVKERILSDLRPIVDNRGYVMEKNSRDNLRDNRQVAKLPEREKITRPTNARWKKLSKFKDEREPDLLINTKNKQNNPVQGKINNRRPQKPEEEVNEEVTEDDNIYTKEKLLSGKKVDSYEDYVVPKKDDIFESEESSKTRQQIKQRGTAQKEKTNNFHNVIALTTDRKETETATVKDKRTPTPEYDDFQEKTTEHEMKARTENIDDIKDPLHETAGRPINKEFFKTLDEDTVINKGKNATRKNKIGTMIPTRKTYKMSSPNYYGKLPKIAEKYNFDEPIPVRDMEPENLKPIRNPPASINRKVKL